MPLFSVHINDLVSVASLNDLRVENTFALIVAVVGVVNVFLSVKSRCLKDPRRVTVIIAMCALCLSGKFFIGKVHTCILSVFVRFNAISTVFQLYNVGQLT